MIHLSHNSCVLLNDAPLPPMYLQVICVVKENKIGLHEFFAVLIYPKKKMMWLLSPLDMYIYIICKLVREQINVG